MRTRTVLLTTIGAAGALALATGWPTRQGLTRSEAAVSLPGDLLLPTAPIVADRAITIHAPADEVWPWLTQIGQDRAGFYSWTAIENAIGCEVTDVHELRPGWATREVGEEVPLAPGMALRVAISSPGHALVLTTEGGRVPEEAEGSPTMQFDLTWAFVLVDEGASTVLHARERYLPHTRAADASCRATLAASAVMTHRMLRTVKSLAESR